MPRKKADGIIPFVQRKALHWHFLLFCFHFVPEMKREFYEEVYPLLRPLPRCENFSTRITICALNRARGVEDDSSEGENVMVDALLNWAKKYHLDSEWAVVPALVALFAIEVPIWDLLAFQQPSEKVSVFSEDEVTFHFTNQGWDPTIEDEETARERMLSALTEDFEDYFEVWREVAKQRGVTPLPQDRESKYSPEYKMEWLIRHMVMKQSIAEIVELIVEETGNTDCDPGYVRKVIRERAKALGFQLPDRRGRPRKITPANKIK